MAFKAAPRWARSSARSGPGKVENGVEPSAVEGLANLPYAVAALRVECALKNTHVPVMFWRSVGSSQNAFAVESFVDELGRGRRCRPLSLPPRAC